MYGLAGERRLTEWEVPGCPATRAHSRCASATPRHEQLQLDVYGEVMDALLPGAHAGRPRRAAMRWACRCKLIEHLAKIWEQPDEGIWEVRGGRRHFTYSKVMAWVAFDRAIKSVEEFGLERPGRALAQRARAQIHARGLPQASTPKLGSVRAGYGSSELDASLLLIPLGRVPAADDPRIAGTVAAIERELMVGRPRAALRHAPDRRRPAGRRRRVPRLQLLARRQARSCSAATTRRARCSSAASRCATTSACSAEEYDPSAGGMLGNFPQAFSHVALINTAHNLAAAPRSRPSSAPAAEASNPPRPLNRRC